MFLVSKIWLNSTSVSDGDVASLPIKIDSMREKIIAVVSIVDSF